ncbi:hypothetical protein ACIRQE_37950, partial [Streptomyces sp. NPDC102264]
MTTESADRGVMIGTVVVSVVMTTTAVMTIAVAGSVVRVTTGRAAPVVMTAPAVRVVRMIAAVAPIPVSAAGVTAAGTTAAVAGLPVAVGGRPVVAALDTGVVTTARALRVVLTTVAVSGVGMTGLPVLAVMTVVTIAPRSVVTIGAT